MYQNIAVLALFALAYSLIAGKVERTAVSGPMIFVFFGILAGPAGLGILAVSPKALEASRASTMRRCYFSFEDMAKTNTTGHFPYTPPTQLFHGLRASLDMLFEEGLDNVFDPYLSFQHLCIS